MPPRRQQKQNSEFFKSIPVKERSVGLTPVKEMDFLEQDEPIRGQAYACISFISPEEVVKKKEIFQLQSFVKAMAQDVDGLLSALTEKYAGEEFVQDMVGSIRERYAYLTKPDEMQMEFNNYVATNAPRLDRDFQAVAGFQTNIRGFKLRGSYETYEEARARAAKISSKDNSVDVFVAQVGTWCPFAPNASEIEDCEYAETQLNTLMKDYKDNLNKKEEFFQRRKEGFASAAMARNNLHVASSFGIPSDSPDDGVDAESPGTVDAADNLSAEDPWIARKSVGASGPGQEEAAGAGGPGQDEAAGRDRVSPGQE